MAEFVEPSLLPPPLRRDLNMRALETVIARLSTFDLTPLVVYDIDNAPVSLLPYLAEQFDVLGDAGWDLAKTDDERRALVKEAIWLHKIKGTPYAVRRALDILGVVATIVEWWQREPKGTPHTFSISISLKEQTSDAVIDAERVAQIQRAVSFWKPVRSHFSMSIGYDKGAELQMRVASVFSATQVLSTSGAMKPFEPGSALALRRASIFTTTELLITSGTLRQKV